MFYRDYPSGALDSASPAAFTAHVHEHPLVNYYRTTGDGQPVKISDFLGRQELHNLGLYSEFFRHIPVEYQMAFSLPAAEGQVVGIALNRARKDFTETDREFQVLQFAAQGCTNRAIARTMGVSPRTIAKHLEHTYRKLGVTSRAAAVYAATTGPAQATLDAAEETWSLPAASHSVK